MGNQRLKNIIAEQRERIAELEAIIAEANKSLDELFGADGEEPDTLSCAMGYLKRLRITLSLVQNLPGKQL